MESRPIRHGQELKMQIVLNRLQKLRQVGQKFGPYLILEILLPGGTLVALLLFLCRDGRLDTAGVVARAGLAVARTLKQGFGMLRPFVRWPVHAYHPAGRATYDGALLWGL
jgi:hypothetical protein